MAKGDSNASQNQIDYQGKTQGQNLSNLQASNQATQKNFQDLYGPAVATNLKNYGDVQGAYDNFLSGMPNQGNLYSTFLGSSYGGTGQGGLSDPTGRGAAVDKAIAGYGNFADTGGFSPEDIQNMRARAIAPIRSMAQTNTDEINRQNAIRGTAYSPNTAASIAKVARDANYAAGDTATNAEANLAQLTQQGKLYGLGGLASTGLGSLANTLQNRGLDLSAITGSGQQQLGALGGKTSLYGTTPGLSNMFGNQVLQAGEQGVQIGGLQNQLAQAIMNAQNQKAGIPGNFQSAMGNLSSLFGLGGAGSNFLSNLFGGGGQQIGSANPGYSGSDPFGNNLPGYDTIGNYGGGQLMPDIGQGGYGPGMISYMNGDGSWTP